MMGYKDRMMKRHGKPISHPNLGKSTRTSIMKRAEKSRGAS
jgi:hypothetical protein